MLRVTSGWAKGLMLDNVSSVRPTKSVVRQALFDILRPRIANVPFIDLFAGSGAIGIEALANEVSSCLFVENDRRVTEVLRRNIARLRSWAERQDRVLGTINCRQESVARFLKNYQNNCPTLVWADPPYRTARFWHDKLLKELQIGVGSTIVFESPVSFKVVDSRWQLQTSKRYGRTMLAIYQDLN